MSHAFRSEWGILASIVCIALLAAGSLRAQVMGHQVDSQVSPNPLWVTGPVTHYQCPLPAGPAVGVWSGTSQKGFLSASVTDNPALCPPNPNYYQRRLAGAGFPVVVQGPPGSTVTVQFDFVCAGVLTGNGQAWAGFTASANGTLLTFGGFYRNGPGPWNVPFQALVSVPANQWFDLWTYVQVEAGGGFSNSSASISLAATGSVVVPPGYLVQSPGYEIVNNDWLGPTYATFGPGCAGPLGVPTNTASPRATLGGTLVVDIGNVPAPEAALLYIGFSNTLSSFGPLPIDLTFLGAAGCFGRVSTDLELLGLGAAGTVSFVQSVPNNAAYLGLRYYTQAFALAPGWNGLGAIASDAAAGTVGN